ncbi:MAG: polysaccharide biosynthesis tyrosine autokinase, partial [Chromatiaceae bacterium]
TYTDEYPRMQELKRQMEEDRLGLEEARSNLVRSLGVDYAGLTDREARLAQAVEEQKQELLELQDRSIQYQILKREWETNRSLYVALLERMKEVGVVAGMERAVGSVIDRALVPTVSSGPYLRNNLLKSLLFGLLGGVGLAFLLNMLDNTVRDPEDVGRLTRLAPLGVVPSIDFKALPAGTPIELLSHSHRDHSLSEAFRSVRTSLMFSAAGGAPRLLMVASSVPGEGKSTTTVNLGIVLAHTGASVLLVDADLRKPRLHRVFKVPRGPGLTELLVREGLDGVFYATGIDNLTLLTAGTPPPNPAELLSSSTCSHLFEELARRYDYVIVDSSPVMGLADPIALSTQVGGVLLVSAAGKVGRSALREAVKRLRAVDATLLGSVLNRIERHSSQYAYYTSYYYNYGASDKRDLSKAA